jgi:hypothetical protein
MQIARYKRFLRLDAMFHHRKGGGRRTSKRNRFDTTPKAQNFNIK